VSRDNKLVKNLPKDLSDPIEVLDLIKDAILRRPTDREEAAKALRQVLKNYESQNRVFLIAAANAELPRILRLLQFLTSCETEMFKVERLEDASNKELIRMYALAQANLMSGLDNIKKVADMRIEALRAAGGGDGVKKLFELGDDKEVNALAGLPSLDAPARDRVRKLVSGLVDIIEEDESVSEYVEDESSGDDPEDQE
jgi:hypothetical protein